MSTTTSQPVQTPTTQLVLPGQAAAPEGPLDLTMMYVMHHGFRRDLDRFATAVVRTPASDRRTWVALAARWELLREVLHHHHTIEDVAIWPVVLDRCTDAERAVLSAMEAEHEQIDPLLQVCADGFARLAEADDVDSKTMLAVRVACLRTSLLDHLAHEETQAVPLLQAHLTREELETVEARSGIRPSVTALFRLVPWVGQDLPEEAMGRVLAQAPGAMRLVWRLTRRRFAGREALAFAYA